MFVRPARVSFALLLTVAVLIAADPLKRVKLGAVKVSGIIQSKNDVQKILRDPYWTPTTILRVFDDEGKQYGCQVDALRAAELNAGDRITLAGKLSVFQKDVEHLKGLDPASRDRWEKLVWHEVQGCKITAHAGTTASRGPSVSGILVSKTDSPAVNQVHFVVKAADGEEYSCSVSPILRVYEGYRLGDQITVIGNVPLVREGSANNIDSCSVVAHQMAEGK